VTLTGECCDIAIVGAGMAGASLAAALAPYANVTLLEMEAQPGYHATGRSAAFWTESYGGPGVLPLTAASGPFLRDHGFLKQRGALTLARQPDEARLRAWAAEFAALGVRMELLAGRDLLAKVPQLRSDWTLGAWEPDCSDIDVAGLHQHYLAAARAAGAGLLCKAEVIAGGRTAADRAAAGQRRRGLG
jgi:D-arginine dehydrogenase